MDTASVAEVMERDIARLKAARPQLAGRIERAEHILVTQLSASSGSRPVKVRIHADGSRSYAVRSGSRLARSYAVDPASWSCECPDHRRRRASASSACKHALACWVLARAFGERAYRPSPAPGVSLEHVGSVAARVLADAAKAGTCSGCGGRFARRELVELDEDNHDDLTHFHGDKLCGECADSAGVCR